MLYEIYKMSQESNFSLQQWQQLANAACFAINQQIKGQAENSFHMFFQNPDLSIITSFFQFGSDTLLFVIFSYIAKNSALLSQDLRFFQTMLRHIRSWQMVGYSFQRDSNRVIENYVSKTFMLALGKLMKSLYQKQQTSAQMINYLQNLPSEYFKLYLFKSFIDAVETIDTEMGYLKYRTMIYSFQDAVIPLICDILMPYFNHMEDGVRVSDLSQQCGQLFVADNQTSDTRPLDISKQLEIQIQYVFMLLGRVLEFNYNITYTQYESQQVIDTCLITFPDKVVEKILNSDFLNSVFFLIQKVSQIKQGADQQNYIKRGLQCLAKLMQARLTYIPQQAKEKYLLHAVRGLTHLLNKCRIQASQQILEAILLCNKKLFINTEIVAIKKIVEKDPLYKSSQIYQMYIQQITTVIVGIISNSEINCQNNLLCEALELANKLMTSYGHPQSQNMDQEAHFFSRFIVQIINSFLPKLCESSCLLSELKVTSVGQAKNNLTGLFENLKKVVSYNYSHLFSRILQGLQYLIDSKKIIGFSNLLLLICQLVDHTYLERNPFLSRAKDNQIAILAVICNNCTTVIRGYQNAQRNFNSKSNSYLSLAIILFCQALLNQFLTDYENSTTVSFQIKKKLYLMMTLGQRYNQPFATEQQSVPTCIMYLNILFGHLSASDQPLTFHILDIIERCIFKLKWNMKRQNFIKSQFFSYFCQYFADISVQNTSIPLELRSRVSKIRVTLTFDDILDEYRFRIANFINLLKRQETPLIFYDLIGVFQGLQTNAITRYFCRTLQSQLNLKSIFDNIFIYVEQRNSDSVYKDAMRLYKSIILNRGLKINQNPVSYKLFTLLMPYLNEILKKICIQPDLDFWNEAIQEMMELMSGIINGTHINIFLLLKNYQQPQRGILFLFLQYFVRMLLIVQQSARQYPKLQQIMLDIINNSNKEIISYVYHLQTEDLSNLYHQLILGTMKLTLQYISEFQGGNKLIEDRLLKGVDCLKTYYSFFNQNRQIRHKPLVIQKLSKFYMMTQKTGNLENFNLNMIFTFVSFVVASQNNSVFTRSIGKLIFELKKCFEQHIIQSFSGVGLSQDRLQALKKILFDKESEQNFLMEFKEWITALQFRK